MNPGSCYLDSIGNSTLTCAPYHWTKIVEFLSLGATIDLFYMSTKCFRSLISRPPSRDLSQPNYNPQSQRHHHSHEAYPLTVVREPPSPLVLWLLVLL